MSLQTEAVKICPATDLDCPERSAAFGVTATLLRDTHTHTHTVSSLWGIISGPD